MFEMSGKQKMNEKSLRANNKRVSNEKSYMLPNDDSEKSEEKRNIIGEPFRFSGGKFSGQ